MKKIILIDEDNSGSVQYLSDYLHNSNIFRIQCVKNPAEVMEILLKDNFDGIILDVMMPIPINWSEEEKRKSNYGSNTGLVLFEKIRKVYPKIPILIYSAKGGVETDEYSYYFRKPELSEAIKNKLIELMEKKE